MDRHVLDTDVSDCIFRLTRGQSCVMAHMQADCPFCTDSESALVCSFAGDGYVRQGGEPDPESAARGFEIPVMTPDACSEPWISIAQIKMGLAGGSHSFKPLRWTLLTLSHL